MMSRATATAAFLKAAASRPVRSLQLMARVPSALRAERLAREFTRARMTGSREERPNPLREFFESRSEGRGLWKWTHYLDVYHRHLAKFMNSDAHLVEVGVYSGGSLEMWRRYLGPNAMITGIDIAEECRVYAEGRTAIAIGDQVDRGFWASFREQNPRIDVMIDDGGHEQEQQSVTLEEILPHLSAGGVYICEDVHGLRSHFAALTHALADQLNASSMVRESESVTTSKSTPFQAAVASIHFYPYMVVIEKSESARHALVAERRGTEWQPFLRT